MQGQEHLQNVQAQAVEEESCPRNVEFLTAITLGFACIENFVSIPAEI